MSQLIYNNIVVGRCITSKCIYSVDILMIFDNFVGVIKTNSARISSILKLGYQ